MKRVLALMVALLMLVTIFAGCGKKEATKSGTMVDGKYVPGGEMEVSVWYTQGTDYIRAETLEDNVVENWLFDKTKVRIKNIYGNDGGQWDVKLSKLIAGDNLPEMVICDSGQGATHFARLAQAKRIHKITDEMIDTYMPNVRKRVPPEMLEGFKIDGALYGIPYSFATSEITQPNMTEEEIALVRNTLVSPAHDETTSIWVRDDILKMIYPNARTWEEICALIDERNEPIGDELFDVPINTTQDYVDFLYKIKDLNLKSENGKTVYGFGYTGGDNWVGLTNLGGDMMGYASHQYTGSWDVKNKKVRIPIVHEAVKEAARIQNKMINDKVIDPESLVHNSNAYTEKVRNGQYAVCAADYAGGIKAVNDALQQRNASFRYRPLYVSIPNTEDYIAYETPATITKSIGFLTTLTDDELIQAMNWVNVQFSDEFEEIFWWGPESEGLYTEDADGVRRYKDEAFNKRYLESQSDALGVKDSRGIGESGQVGMMYVTATNIEHSRWNPVIANRAIKLTPYNYGQRALKFKADSPHVTELVEGKNATPWASIYGNIDEVIKYWSQREQWENPFKIALSVPVNEFDAKWQDAIDNINRIVDIKTMEEKMTKAVKQQK